MKQIKQIFLEGESPTLNSSRLGKNKQRHVGNDKSQLQ